MLVKDVKKMNPFKALALVVKYEFKNAAKKFIPLYAVLLIVALVGGLLQSPFSEQVEKITQERAQIEMNGDVDAYSMQMELRSNDFKRGVIYTVIYFFLIIYSIAIVIISVLNLSKRFKKSMLQDEAYLNLVLPVSMSQHIWGRFINALIWMIICLLVISVSSCFYMIRNGALEFLPELVDIFKENGFEKIGCSLPMFFFTLIAFIFMILISIILAIYFVNSFAHLFPKARTLIKICSIILCIYLFFNLPKWVIRITDDIDFVPGMWLLIGTYFVLSAVYMTVTQLVFMKRLNLE